ncbi:hypothetical protein D3C75_727610 [compost metagenome]
MFTLAADLLQARLDLAQAYPQQAAVGFQLGFTRAAQADTAFLPLKVSPAAHQPRAHVLELGQFDLQLAFMGTRPLGEDIEDQPGTVEHTTLEHTFEVALLTGREGVIENHQVYLFGMDQVVQLFDLATANQVFGGRLMPCHRDQRDDVGTGRQCQLLKLLRVFARLRVLTFQVNEQRPLTTTVALKEQCRLLSGVAWLAVAVLAVGRAWQADRTGRNYGRDGVLVDHLADGVLQQYHELVERFDRALQFDTVDQVNGYRDLFFSQGVQVRVL